MPKDDSPVSATRAWIEEVHQEAGIEPEEVRSPTISGYVMDLHWPHPDITHVAYIGPILEDVFNREGCRLKPRRPTDKEVEMRCIPWTADHARALLVGDVIEGGDDDLRPWVPPGIASVLLAGYRDFGKDWFASVLAEYTERIRAL
jgi:hypothetical protein